MPNILREKRFLLISAFFVIFGAFIFRHLILDRGILYYGDTLFPVNEQSLSTWRSLVSHIWWDHEFLGYDTTIEGIPRISYVVLLSLGYFVFRDFSVVQFLWWVLIFALSGVSMYWLARYLFKKDMIAFAAALLYALNPWVVDRTWHPTIWQAYAFIPLLFLLYILLLDKKKLGYAILFAIAAFFIIPSHQYTFMVAMLLFLYLLYRLMTGKEWAERKSYILNSLKVTAVTVSFLGFYCLPLIITRGGTALTAFSRWAATGAGLTYGQDCTVLNVIRLLGFHGSMFKGSILGAALSPEPPVGWTLLTFVIPVLWIFPLLSKSNRRELKAQYFFYFLLLIGILLSTSATLLGGVLFKHLNFMPLMHDPHYYVFILAFAGAPLFGIGAYLVVDKMRRFLNRINLILLQKSLNSIMAVFLVSVVCFISYPVMLWEDYRYKQVEYPEEYEKMADFINQAPGDFRVLMLPPDTSLKHSWAPYFWIASEQYLLNKPIFGRWTLEATQQASIDFSVLVDEALQGNPSPYLVRLLRLANVRYIVVMNDCESQPPDIGVDPGRAQRYLSTLNSQKDISLERQFGDVFIYKVDDDQFLPHIYSAETIIYPAHGDTNAFIATSSLSDGKSTCVFLKDGGASSVQSRVTVRKDEWYDLFVKSGLISNDPSGEIVWERLYQHTPTNADYVGKFFPDGCHGSIEEMQYYTRNNSGKDQTVIITFAPEVGGPEIFSVSDTIPDGTPEGWRTVAVRQPWNYDSCFIYIKGPTGGEITPRAGNGPKGGDSFVSHDSGVTWKADSGIGQKFFRIIRSLSQSTLEVDGKPLEVGQEITAAEDGWMSFGSIYLEEGEHNIEAYTKAEDGQRILISGLELAIRSSEPAAEIIFEKVDATKYIAQVQASEPFFLVFSESFSRQWHAYVSSDRSATSWFASLFKGGIPEDDHFQVNGYANAWYVDPEMLGVKGESFTITIYYRPQSFFYIGWIISGVTFISAIGYLIWDWFRGRSKGAKLGG